MRKGALCNGLKHDMTFTARTAPIPSLADSDDAEQMTAQKLTLHKAVMAHSTEYFRTLLLSKVWRTSPRSAEDIFQADGEPQDIQADSCSMV